MASSSLDACPLMPTLTSTHHPDFGKTGYLEDALIEFSIRFKRQRLLPENSNSSSSVDSSSHISCDNFDLWTENCSFELSKEEINQTTNLQSVCLSDCKGRYQNFEAGDGCVKGERKEEMSRKRSTSTRLAYPFGMVKPGGIHGDLTLDDINKRILKPPTRPVRHPVGDYACLPTVVSPRGPGLSGKAIVALTRIHTQGTGTITIIRTKG